MRSPASWRRAAPTSPNRSGRRRCTRSARRSSGRSSRPRLATPSGRGGRRRDAGLDVVDLRTATLRTEFFDVGALVYYLRLVVWIVPDFSVDRYRDRLRRLHEQIQRDGPFVAHATRFLIEARKPG